MADRTNDLQALDATLGSIEKVLDVPRLKVELRDLEEQAMVDGYSRLGAFVRTVLPLSFPGMVAVVVFSATLSASEFIYALAFVSQTSQKTISPPRTPAVPQARKTSRSPSA